MQSTAEAFPAGMLVAGRYEVERVLGSGGTSTVYAVVDRTNGRPMALKMLFPSASPSSAALFEREYRTLSGLRHPNIVEVFEYGIDAQSTYYTMELLEGSDLRAQAPMAWRDACACLRELASVLGLLHARRLVHRDLSPTNLWRTPSGKLKLLDFGSLAPVGPISEIVGTPQFIAPEVLGGGPLDPRVDLFAMGALAYWLITGVHAFPATRLEELRRAWARTPTPPSELLLLEESASSARMPAEVDSLILSLLRMNPDERPSSTAALIDRLNAAAGLEPEQHALAARGYLESKVFVGRAAELERMADLLTDARFGTGHTLLIKGAPGFGRTRLLAELRVMAQLAGAVTLSFEAPSADGVEETRPYGYLSELATRLLRTLPEAARAAADGHESKLALLGPSVAELLGVRPSHSSPPGELRAALKSAVRDWFLGVARDRLLALFCDDAEALDDDSIEFLAALAHAAKSRKLLVVVTLRRTSSRAYSAALESLRGKAVRTVLEPLTSVETLELLQSVFGRAPYLERLAERIRTVTQGSPGRTLELARHLIATGVARYADGMWSLPAELGPSDLPEQSSGPPPSHFEHLTPVARALAQLLSIVPEGAIPRLTFLAAAEVSRETAERALEELLLEGVLHEDGRELRFAHESLRVGFAASIGAVPRAELYRRLANAELSRADDDPSAKVRAALHLLRAGERRSALALLTSVELSAKLFGGSCFRDLAQPLESCVQLLREQRARDHELAVPIAVLACAGYYVHRRYGKSYGEDAIGLLERALELSLARKLKPLLGGKLAVMIALFVGSVILLVRGRTAPSARTLLRWFLFTCSTLARASTVCLDGEGTARYGRAVEPLTALGVQHPANFVHGFCAALSLHSGDRPALAVESQRRVLAQLESGEMARRVPAELTGEYLSALYFAIGLNELRRDGSEVLRIADRLEQLGPLSAMSADYLRASHYAYQADSTRAETYRQRLEQHAIQIGSVWQVAAWGPSDGARVALRVNDAILMKRAAEELVNMAADIPSLSLHERHARGAYLVMRAKYREALPLLEVAEEPLAVLGYCHRRGLLARAYRELGNPERARQICDEVLKLVSPDDLTFSVANLNVQIEFALADAELGQLDGARRRLDVLLAFHDRYRGPLTLGALHEARAAVALVQHDLKSAQRHLTAMDGWYRPTGIPTLLEQVESVRRRLEFAVQRDEADRGGGMFENDSQLVDRVKFLLGRAGNTPEECGQRVLQIALLLSRADEGFIMLPRNRERPLAQLGAHTPDRELILWATERLAASCMDEATQIDVGPARRYDENVRKVFKATFIFVPLWSSREDEGVVAGLVLGAQGQRPRLPPAKMLVAMAQQLGSSKG